jgi:hypothetical protein
LKKWKTIQYSWQDIEELHFSVSWRKDVQEVLDNVQFKYRTDILEALYDLWKSHQSDIAEAHEEHQVKRKEITDMQGNEQVWGHPLWSKCAIKYTALFKEVYGDDIRVIFFDLWSDATLVWNTSHWPAGIRLCSRKQVLNRHSPLTVQLNQSLSELSLIGLLPKFRVRQKLKNKKWYLSERSERSERSDRS